jgi:hypothetical protein
MELIVEERVEQLAPVLGHELLLLLQRLGGTARADAFRNAAAGAFGPDAVYANCHGDRFSFDEALRFFAAKGKVLFRGDDVLIGSVPACVGH